MGRAYWGEEVIDGGKKCKQNYGHVHPVRRCTSDVTFIELVLGMMDNGSSICA